ncbi:MAG: peptidyl-prolyl cis-trans isomerase [Proteobacteria bacterium]|nr:peptidyl-prolyl cis-trans isomerase [Pseudomonadota bacterium]
MTDGFRRACLIAAVVVGCTYSAFQILHDVRVPVQLLPGVAARVNGHQIDADSVNRTVAGMDARMRGPEAAARHDVLTRMIDEELLVQHALDSGAAQTNPEVRAALVRSAITRVNSEAAAEPVSEAELSQYFAAHREVYATAASFDVTPVYFEGEGADDAGDTGGGRAGTGLTGAWGRAAAARAAIDAGAPLSQATAGADPLPFNAPCQHVTPRTVATYFGPSIADAVSRLPVGHTTEPTRLGNGVVYLYLNNKTPGEIPALAGIHDLVAADAMRDRQEHALEALLASLRQSAHIEFATSPSSAPPVTASR